MKSESQLRKPSVAVGVVVQRGDYVLLVRRGKEPHRGVWSIPGGHIEYGETISDAARREVSEECGIEIQLQDCRLILTRIGRDGNGIQYHYVIIDLLAHWVSGEAIAGDDAEFVQWVRHDEIDKLETSPGLPGYVRDILEGSGTAVVSDFTDAAE